MFSLSRGDRHGVDFWEMVRDCCLGAVRALIPISSPRGRRSRPLQRGARECKAWNERIYLTVMIRLRLRRAELQSGVARCSLRFERSDRGRRTFLVGAWHRPGNLTALPRPRHPKLHSGLTSAPGETALFSGVVIHPNR